MLWLEQNWTLLVVLVAIVTVAFVYIKRFTQLTPEDQLANVREWLLYAVTLAEKEYSAGGMGKIKLRAVYQSFLVNFPWLAKVITFDQFSQMVDEALEQMRLMLESNKNIQNFVGK